MKILTGNECHPHEAVVIMSEKQDGVDACLVINSTALGPAVGPVRMVPVNSADEALDMADKLSQALTLKSAGANIPAGGGAAVIAGDPKHDKTPEKLRAFARGILALEGRLILAADAGTNASDLGLMQEVAPGWVFVDTPGSSKSAWAAFGVVWAMKAAAVTLKLHRELYGLTVAVQGLGKVGYPLAKRLHDHGAQLIVTAGRRETCEPAVKEFGARYVPPEEIYSQRCDFFAPCSPLQGPINKSTIPKLQCRVICGGANLQLQNPYQDGTLLQLFNMHYVPDFIANAGALIYAVLHHRNWDDMEIEAGINNIYHTTLEVLQRSQDKKIPPLEAAQEIASGRIKAARQQNT